MCGCHFCLPYWGPGSQPRHVPRLGIGLATLWFAGWYSTHWATSARASLTSWLSDFHTVWFSVSSSCFFVFKFVVVLLLICEEVQWITYASILAGSLSLFLVNRLLNPILISGLKSLIFVWIFKKQNCVMIWFWALKSWVKFRTTYLLSWVNLASYRTTQSLNFSYLQSRNDSTTDWLNSNF